MAEEYNDGLVGLPICNHLSELLPKPSKIVTSYIYPPIPTRSFDWCAHYDGEEERGGYGWGATKEEAIADFKENCDG